MPCTDRLLRLWAVRFAVALFIVGKGVFASNQFLVGPANFRFRLGRGQLVAGVVGVGVAQLRGIRSGSVLLAYPFDPGGVDEVLPDLINPSNTKLHLNFFIFLPGKS